MNIMVLCDTSMFVFINSTTFILYFKIVENSWTFLNNSKHSLSKECKHKINGYNFSFMVYVECMF